MTEGAPHGSAHDGRRSGPFVAVLALCAASLAIAAWASPLFEGSLSPQLAYVVAFSAVSAELLLAARFVPLLPPRVAGALAFAAALCLFALRGQAPTLPSALAVTLCLLSASTLLGAVVGARIQVPGHLLAVFGVSALADLWSVYDPTGPSAQLAQQVVERPEQLVLFALAFPMLGSTRIEAIIGAGDIVFAALYLATLRRHGLAATRTAWAMFGAMLAGLLLILIFERALPLLPLIGAAVVLAEPRTRSLPPQDRRSFGVVLVVLSAFLVYRLLR